MAKKIRHAFDETNRSLCNRAWWSDQDQETVDRDKIDCGSCLRVILAERRAKKAGAKEAR